MMLLGVQGKHMFATLSASVGVWWEKSKVITHSEGQKGTKKCQ